MPENSRSRAHHAARGPVLVESCIPVIPTADLEPSLRFWLDGVGLTMDRAMRQDGRLIGCMVHNATCVSGSISGRCIHRTGELRRHSAYLAAGHRADSG